MSQIIASDLRSDNFTYDHAVEPAIDPANKPIFLIDWELTLKCNLDCSYCATGPDGGHWNASKHPPLNECKRSADFMFRYADLYMLHKKNWAKAVALNVYGGESLYHPNILEILEYTKKTYSEGEYQWPLTVTCTTNLVIKQNTLQKVIPFIDEFTISYHVEARPEQKKTVKNNIEYLHSINHPIKIVILMHSNPDHWAELQDLILYCDTHEIPYIVRQLDGDVNSNYNQWQRQWFKDYYISKSYSKTLQNNNIENIKDSSEALASLGRSCCGGRNMCVNQNYKQPLYWISNNNFHDWHCSVNWFFVYIKQLSQDVYTNKDCKMNFDGSVGPIGNIQNYQEILDITKDNLTSKSMPVIQCKKDRCVCGLCAPKALTKELFSDIMKKHVTENVFK